MRKSFLDSQKIYFDHGYYCEDQLFSLRTVCECGKPGLFLKNVYVHLSNEGSLSKTDNFDKLKIGINIEFSYNKYLQNNSLLSVCCRNFLIGGLLYRIYLQSHWLYRWYCIQELVLFGWEIAWADYKQSCIQRNIRPNFWCQLTDPIRVWFGAIFRR